MRGKNARSPISPVVGLIKNHNKKGADRHLLSVKIETPTKEVLLWGGHSSG
jgi:hypothetical protein